MQWITAGRATPSATLVVLATLAVAPLATVTAETAATPEPNTQSTAIKVAARAARRGGYRVVERDGDTLYCRKELAELNDATQRSLKEMSRHTPPPRGN
jgi:hypothetical protein